jgi:hypothetical protein
MKKLYVRFAGDNDFGNVMLAFVKAIAPRIFFEEWADITKEQIVELFNKTSSSLYYLHQSRNPFVRDERIEEYLKIETKDVMFEDESDKFFCSGQDNHDGCLAVMDYNCDIDYIIY